ncbi:hypothetical protein FNV43_RR23489 [Rhamnella rubrinervis]|uniref:Uncharacterized protein n=1 Tax=Rhamnella rubrinervis TaxID=2594499 RepID=A0A8K0DS38_9ROSA|nr:hypothetical protein FNV43_RR23489 [Rhamnella rubrinervis]
MPASFSGLGNLLPSRLFRQLEQEMETVIKVLQPGPLGIIEHKFSAEEIREANATVHRAVANWRRNANLEQKNPILKDYIHNYLDHLEGDLEGGQRFQLASGKKVKEVIWLLKST